MLPKCLEIRHVSDCMEVRTEIVPKLQRGGSNSRQADYDSAG